ncbi:MAG: AEC family transporter [Rhodobacteraceae bacterium]|nr:AEC family transporter [Paracoccaceae bacterium]
MFDILETVLPVFLIVGAGYVAVRTGLFEGAFADGLMRFTQTFAIPCLLFLSIARLDLVTVFQPAILLTFYIGSALMFATMTLIARLVFQHRPGQAVAVGFCALFANSVLLGIPLVGRAFGEAALAPVVAIVAVHAPFCYTLGITTMEFARADGRPVPETLSIVLKSIFSNGLMIGILLGFAANLTGFMAPGPIIATLEMLAAAAIPAALFGLGGILVRYGVSQNPGEIAVIGGLRLVVHPLVVLFLATQIFDLPPLATKALVLAAAMPPGVNVLVFATMYDRAKGVAAASILASTVAAVFSATAWLAILQVGGL